MAIRVVVVDDHQVVRTGLATLLGDEPEFVVAAMVGTAAEALEAVRDHQPEVLLLDLRLPDRQGVDIIPDVKALSPRTRILVLTSYGDDDSVAMAVAKGVDGFLTKTTDGDALLENIRKLAAGVPLLRDQVSDALVRYLQRDEEAPAQPTGEALTARETQVAAYVAEGYSNREIAEQLGVSEKTVKNHISNILSKMNVHSRSRILLSFRSRLKSDDSP